MFAIATAHSLESEPEIAARQAADGLRARLGRAPDFVVAFATEHLARPGFAAALSEALPGAAVFGGTSCRGVLTEQGFHTGPDGAAALLGICDEEGDYGVGAASLDGDPAAAAAAALSAALEQAGRPFESPSLIMVIQPPGEEEAILEGLTRIAGPHCPVLGGSSADEALAGNWRQFAGGAVLQDHVVVAALFHSVETGRAFQSGYVPTEMTGCVTECEGRTIGRIDGRPAAEVFAEWSGGAVRADAPGVILPEATWTPLGRRVEERSAYDEFILSHPSEITADGALRVFSDIAVGDRLVAMAGDRDSLVGRGARVASDAMEIAGLAPDSAAGALMIFCGGCMMAVQDRVPEVGGQLSGALGGKPFLCAFTFGEQGALVSRQNRHGNLMVAAAVFGADNA